jgi:hypothetical protein
MVKNKNKTTPPKKQTNKMNPQGVVLGVEASGSDEVKGQSPCECD